MLPYGSYCFKRRRERERLSCCQADVGEAGEGGAQGGNKGGKWKMDGIVAKRTDRWRSRDRLRVFGMSEYKYISNSMLSASGVEPVSLYSD